MVLFMLKRGGSVTRYSTLGFFIKQYPLDPWFWIFCFEFAEIWSIFERKNRACGVNDTTCTKILFMWCQLHRMRSGVIDTACMVHAVSLTLHARLHAESLTPHAQKFFQTTSKSQNHMQKRDGIQKKIKMYAVSMTSHARCIRCHWHHMHDACCVTGYRKRVCMQYQ
jgi:N-acetylglutamate synthase-like GNAT family acetyltransferase